MDPAIAQSEKERRVAAEPVEFGDDEGGAGQTGQLDGFGQFGPVGVRDRTLRGDEIIPTPRILTWLACHDVSHRFSAWMRRPIATRARICEGTPMRPLGFTLFLDYSRSA